MTDHAGPEDTPPTGRSPRATGHPTERGGPAAPARPLPRDAGSWASKVDRLTETRVGSSAANVVGRRLTGPVQGFGKMWRKTYRMNVGSGIAPQRAIATWKEHFAEFWPQGNTFEPSLTGISPGEVALLDVGIGGGARLSTGVFVLYADEVSFTLMTPQGHMFAGWITFSAERAPASDGHQAPRARPTVVQAQVLMRANDPLYELAMTLGGHRKEDEFWIQTMTALAKYLGAPPVVVHTRTVCIDPRRQWGHVGAVWHNSMVRTALQTMAAPLSAVARRRRRARRSSAKRP
jgi:hypothetical protein